MNRVYRTLIAISTVLPMAVSLAFVFAPEIYSSASWLKSVVSLTLFQFLFTFVTAIACFLFALISKYVLACFAKYRVGVPIIVNTVRKEGSSSLMDYLPYVLPLFIVQGQAQSLCGWIIGLLVLLVLAYSSNTISYSPFLRLVGVRFYDVEIAAGKRFVTVISFSEENFSKEKYFAVKISDYCYIV